MATTQQFKDRWNSEPFASKEIDQLLWVAAELVSGVSTIDARRLSPKVRRWLEHWNYCEKTPAGFAFTSLACGQYSSSWLPLEALWRVVSPMLGDSRSAGHSICKNHGWRVLNVFSADQALYSTRDEETIADVLATLDSYGYIYFQSAGSVWEVTERKDGAAFSLDTTQLVA